MDSKYSSENRVQFQNKIYITETSLAYSLVNTTVSKRRFHSSTLKILMSRKNMLNDKYYLFQKEGSTVQYFKYSCLARTC
ncbi:hypothetical protein LOK49_LG12G00873 [Camellia lanceoleosa]|uniref:Uncharacterized protein n=1 Tax=Camellia lanceoleosa TaxID=1840588 RepID=A0ACC0FV65_9ERIC|nr:hypothetical protein LOK49_LG12G00873 [Camellia lanceoleosa]